MQKECQWLSRCHVLWCGVCLFVVALGYVGLARAGCMPPPPPPCPFGVAVLPPLPANHALRNGKSLHHLVGSAVGFE